MGWKVSMGRKRKGGGSERRKQRGKRGSKTVYIFFLNLFYESVNLR